MNSLTIVGRVVKDPELKSNDKGEFCFISVAVTDTSRDKAEFFNCNLSGKQATNCHKYVKKGDTISVTGSVHLSQFGEGNRYASMNVRATRVEFLGKRGAAVDGDTEDELPNAYKSTPKAPNSGYMQIDEEDMPF